MRKRGKHGRVAGDRRVLQAEALADIHTSPPILRRTSGVVDSFPAAAPLRHTYSAVDTVPRLAVSSRGGRGNLAQRESVVAAGVVLVAAEAGAVVAVEEVVVVAAVDGLRRRRTVWCVMPPPVGRYR